MWGGDGGCIRGGGRGCLPEWVAFAVRENENESIMKRAWKRFLIGVTKANVLSGENGKQARSIRLEPYIS